MCVKENYTSEVLFICVFIALLWGAGNICTVCMVCTVCSLQSAVCSLQSAWSAFWGDRQQCVLVCQGLYDQSSTELDCGSRKYSY